MKSLFNILSISIIAILVISCQDVIEIEVPDNPPLLVLNGRITDTEPVHVTLSTTAAYFSQAETPRIREAEVTLFEDGQALGVLVQDSLPGLYTGPFFGQVGKSYHLEILIKEDNPDFAAGQYITAPEPLNRIFEIDSIYLSFQEARPPFTGGFLPAITFTEPAGVGDIYRVLRWRNDTLFDNIFFTINDEFADGLQIGVPPLPPFTLAGPMNPNDTFYFEIASITATYDKYLSILLDQTFRSAGVFAPPPAPIIGNVMGSNGEIALGYFSASAIKKDGITYRE